MTTEPPLVSVALCVYNGAGFLAEQLDSILAQEDVRLEVVAVDDCSTDDSLALLHRYAARDPRIRVFRNDTNLGHLRSFDRAMSLCDGPLIAPSDQDDRWHPRKLRRLLDALGEADMAYCDSEYIDCDGNPLGRRISEDLDAMHQGRDPLRFLFQNTVSGHALLVRRDVFEAARPFPELLYHDWWLAMRAASGNGVVYVAEPLVQFRRHAAAFSPLGKKRGSKAARVPRAARPPKAIRRAEARQRARNRQWVEERLYLGRMLAATDWPGHARAGEWLAALLAAQDGELAPLRALCWRDRDSLPPFHGPAWYRAFRFYQRCRRKVRHARTEAVPANLFRA